MRRRPLAMAGASVVAVGLLALPATPAGGQTTDPDPTVLTVDVSKPFKPVDHAASGALYGIGDEGWPPDEWIAPTKPKMFTQPPPGATHLPNQEPAPVGDTLDVAPVAARNGATITVRLPDIFPTFPYQWQGDEFWYSSVETMVRAVQASGADNIYGYEIWNEPQWTWNPEWGDYFEMWDRTYRLIRELDPDTPIIGPSYDRDYENGLREFFTRAVNAGTVPDIVSWHELGPEEGLHVSAHVAFYRELERELGFGPLPISINEYGSPRDAGVPGWLTRFVAKLERAKVDTANLAFWHKPGRLADLLVPAGGGSGPATDPEPTGNYPLFTWYGEMTGQMVQTTPPAEVGRFIEIGEPVPAPATRITGQPGFGNALRLGGPEPNEYVALPAGIVGGLTDFTVATWVNPAATTTWSRIFDFGTGQQTNMFLTVNAGGGPRFAITTGGGGAEQRVDSTAGQLPTNQWTHLAVTKSGSTATLYRNGEPVGSNPNLTLSPADLGSTDQNWIGRSQYPDPLFNGTVDEFQIFDRGLSQSEVQSLMVPPAGSGGNVAWYRFDEPDGATALDASGNGRDATVATGITGVELVPALDGFASADPATNTVRVIFGGGQGDIRLDIDGLAALRGFGGMASVQVFTTEWTGTDGVSQGPVALFDGTYPVRDGSISVPVAGVNESDAYLAVVTPAGAAPPFEGPVRRHEAETADREGMSTATSPLASTNRYVQTRRPGFGALTFTVDAPVAGAYDLGIRYANRAGEAVPGAVLVNGAPRERLQLQPTPDGRFATHGAHVVLAEGSNQIRLELLSSALSVDYVEVTPFRTRVEAETGEFTSADLVEVDMSAANFFAAYFSGAAYVRNLSQPASALRLPVSVPAAGTYELTIGYSTAGSQQDRRAQIPAGQLLRVGEGPWQPVVYPPTQFREMIRQTTVLVELPAGSSTLTFSKQTEPGTVDLDYVDVKLRH